MPVTSPAHTSTSTIVVESHSSEPSDSTGTSVGTRYAETVTCSIGIALPIARARPILMPVRYSVEYLGENFLCPLDYDPFSVWIVFHKCCHQILGLLETDVRRQNRYVRIGNRLNHYGAVSRERFVPRGTNPLWLVNANPLETKQLGVSCIGEIGQVL